MTVDVAIASFKEPLDWLWVLPADWRVFIYNTSQEKREFPQGINPIKIPNGGREAGQWLYHLANQYPDFSDYTLFLQGRPFDHEAHALLNLIKTHNFDEPIRYVNGLAPRKHPPGIPPHPDCEKFLRRGWKDRPIPSPIWFTCGAQFYVRRDVILSRPQEHYAEIQKAAYDPEIHSFGHRMEPLWGCIFDWHPFVTA